MTHILVTNDDGVTAPGLLALAREMQQLGDVTILAPDRNWSASGHVKTMHRPLRVKSVQLVDNLQALASDGAPSDCVALAMMGVVERKIDLVVSGINPNANFGTDITYSGTVTAAMEAVIQGGAGVAVSLDSPENHNAPLDFGPAARYARRIISTLLKSGIPERTVININVPYLAEEAIKGVQITRYGVRVYNDALVRRDDPRGRPYYWIGGDTPSGIPDEGTDYGALKAGYVSVTPLKLDMTNYSALQALRKINLNGS